jgi:5-formyltetrahydrofolate cyclo-ligase
MTRALLQETGLDEPQLAALVQRFYAKARSLETPYYARPGWEVPAFLAGLIHNVIRAGDLLRRKVSGTTRHLACTRGFAADRRLNMTEDDETGGRNASLLCMASEIAPDYFDPRGVDARSAAGPTIALHLRDLSETLFAGVRGSIFSAYWPIKGEPDLRALMSDLHASGATIALPVVETRAVPPVVRNWTPGTRMARGDGNIPVPPPVAVPLTPDVALAQLMEWTDTGFRPGNGGGYFDRTLADPTPRPATIGIGFQSARLSTIYPQLHDIPLDISVTEAGVQTKGKHHE